MNRVSPLLSLQRAGSGSWELTFSLLTKRRSITEYAGICQYPAAFFTGNNPWAGMGSVLRVII
ncbi:hypothetical protein [Blautia obeum]|uniref:hypothetical protein n=1 Tax=Blautia obeum TaxID=40520 RepID=UPI0025ED3CC2|nr:hypothetical protein [uncultured Blautia sp.]